MKLGAIIRMTRKNARFAQAGLAEKIGVHEVTVISWERNACQPCISNVIKLCKALNITESELLNG